MASVSFNYLQIVNCEYCCIVMGMPMSWNVSSAHSTELEAVYYYDLVYPLGFQILSAVQCKAAPAVFSEKLLGRRENSPVRM